MNKIDKILKKLWDSATLEQRIEIRALQRLIKKLDDGLEDNIIHCPNCQYEINN